jgi:maleate isomerase
VLGAEAEARMMEEMAETTGAPVVSTNDAVGRCIARQQPQRVAVITPYIDELNVRIREGLERRGLNVVHISGMGNRDSYAMGLVPPAEIVAFAEARLAGVGFDLLFVSCTAFRAVEARPALMERFGVPVVTSNQATIDATLEALDRTASPSPAREREPSAR